MKTEAEILNSLSQDAQKCVEYIKEHSHNTSNIDLIRLCGCSNDFSVHTRWDKIEKELQAIANRSEIMDYKDEPDRNRPGKLLRESFSGVWSYDPVL